MGHPEHAMSAALHALTPSASVAIKGPFGTFRYQPGKYKAIGEHPTCQASSHQCPSAMKLSCAGCHVGRLNMVACLEKATRTRG